MREVDAIPNKAARTASNLACFSSRWAASCCQSGFFSASLAMRSASFTSSDSLRTSSLKSICSAVEHSSTLSPLLQLDPHRDSSITL